MGESYLFFSPVVFADANTTVGFIRQIQISGIHLEFKKVILSYKKSLQFQSSIMSSEVWF